MQTLTMVGLQMPEYKFDNHDWEMILNAICFYDMYKEDDFNDEQDLAWNTIYAECRHQLKSSVPVDLVSTNLPTGINSVYIKRVKGITP